MKPKHYLRLLAIGLVIALVIFFAVKMFALSSTALILALAGGALGVVAIAYLAVSHFIDKNKK